MNILLIANSESVHTARFAIEFAKRGHEVLLISATPYWGRVVKYNAEIKHIHYLKFLTDIFNYFFKHKIQNFNPENSNSYHIFNFLILFRMIYLFFLLIKLLKKKKLTLFLLKT